MGSEYSHELTQISRFLGESAIFLVPSEGFEVVKFFPRLHYASFTEGSAPKAPMLKPRPKREVPKPGMPLADSQAGIEVNLYQINTNFIRKSDEFHVNSRNFTQMLALCTPSFVLTPKVRSPMHPRLHPGHK